MKKRWIVVFVLALTFIVAVAVAQEPAVKRYWQDVLRKPSQAWIELYGYNNESVLAFNVRSLLEVQESMARTILALQADVEALESPVDVNDPNEVKE